MASVQRHPTHSGRMLKTAFKTAQLRCIQTRAPLHDAGQPATPHQPPLRSTLRNQAAYNAIKEAGSEHGSEAAVTIRKFIKDSPGFSRKRGVTDAQNNSSQAKGDASPRIAFRRIPNPTMSTSAMGAAPGGSRPTRARFPDQPGGGVQRPRGPDGTRRGAPSGQGNGARSAPPHKKRASRAAQPDHAEEGEKLKVMTEQDFMMGRIPKNIDMSEAEREYHAQRLHAQEMPREHNPSLEVENLMGKGPATLVSPLGRAELLHRAFSRTATVGNTESGYHPVEQGYKLFRNEHVYLRSDAEAAMAQETFRSIPAVKTAKPDIELVPDRERVNSMLFAGKYTPLGGLAGKNTSDAMREVWRQAGRNETYIVRDETSLAKKVASLVPNRAPSARPAAAKKRATA